MFAIMARVVRSGLVASIGCLLFAVAVAYGQAAKAGGSISSSVAKGPKQPAKNSEAEDSAGYCSTLADNVKNAFALEKACEFALAMRGKLPDVICDQQTKRSWAVAGSDSDSSFPTALPDQETHSDTVTAKVSYRDGHEYYDNVRVNGKPVAADGPWTQGGAWSIGEFASILSGIFAPSSKPEFRYEKQEKLHSVATIVFEYRVKEENNRTYFIDSGSRTWFPGYSGKLWLDTQTTQLRRLERETDYMRERPVRRIKTTVDYREVPLGDGTKLILPTNSEVVLCLAAAQGSVDSCSQNAITFKNWQKFGAKTTIVVNSSSQQ